MKNLFLVLLLFLSLSCTAAGRNNALQTGIVITGAAIGSVFGPTGAIGGAALGDLTAEVFFPDPVEYPTIQPSRTDTFSESLREVMTSPPQNSSWFQSLISTFLKYTFYGVALIFLLPFLFKKGRAYIKAKLQTMRAKLPTNKFNTKYSKKLNKIESKNDSDNF